MNWSRSRFVKNIPKIKRYIAKLIKTCNKSMISSKSKEYIDFDNRFKGLFSLGELRYWLKNDLSDFKLDIFLCKECGKPVKYRGGCYCQYCSSYCCNHSSVPREKAKNTCMSRYGVENGFQSEYIKSKIRKTNLSKYGVENPSQCTKIKEAKRKTSISNWGTDNPSQSAIVKERVRSTNLKRYGCTCSLHGKDIHNKCVATNLSKYGVEHHFSNTTIQKRIKQTNLIRYGVEQYGASEDRIYKARNTCLDKYGVDSYSKTKDFKQKVGESKRNNCTFNTSRPEEDIYKLLCKCFGKRQVKRQYRSDLYPFNCDFYLPQFDLYMEYNGSWTHGGEPYSSRRKQHKELLKDWEKRGIKAPYYKEAIRTWTVRDPLKRKTAKRNELRYIEFWNLDQVKVWLDKYGGAKRFSCNMITLVETI